MSTPATPAPAPVKVAVHAPYEDAIIAGFVLLKDVFDGMSPQQKQQAWQQWIDFWTPLVNAVKSLTP